MKFSAQEELGIRCLIQVARHQQLGGITIHDIAALEQMTIHNAAKLLRILRIGGYIESTRGQVGGYTLSRPAHEIKLGEVLETLGGRLFEAGFCEKYTGNGEDICVHNISCTLKGVWQKVQQAVDSVVYQISLADLFVPLSATNTTQSGQPHHPATYLS